MRRFLPTLLLLLVACGGSDGGPVDPGTGIEFPDPLAFAYMNRRPQPDDLHAVSQFGDRAVAVGQAGTIVVRERNDGRWRRVPGITREDLNDVVMLDEQNVLACGVDGSIRSTDGGLSWGFFDDTPLMRAIAVHEGRGVIVGRNTIRSDDLQTWSKVMSAPRFLNDVDFSDGLKVWAANRDTLFLSEDAGETWLPQSLADGTFTAFEFASEFFGVAAMQNGRLYNTTNGGTFTQIETFQGVVDDIFFPHPGLGVLVTREGRVYTSTSQGKAWTFEAEYNIEQFLGRVSSGRFGDLVVVGNEGLIMEGTAATLVELSSGPGIDLHAVAFANRQLGFALDASQRDKPLAISTDGGTTWTEGPNPLPRPMDIKFHGPELGLILDQSGQILKSTDQGSSWVDTGASSNEFMQALLIIDDQTWLACGSTNSVVYTHDAGANWDVVFVEGDLAPLSDMDVFPGTDVVIATSFKGPLRSTDRGETWTRESGTENLSMNGVVCLNANTAIAYGNPIYRTTDQGLSWEPIEFPDETIDGGGFLDELHGVVAGERGTILETTDGGLTWLEVQMVDQDMKAVAARDEGSLFIVGENGAIIGGFPANE